MKPAIAVPYHIPVFDMYFKELGAEAERIRFEDTQVVLREFFETWDLPVVLSSEESVGSLTKLLLRIEQQIQFLIDQHHLYYWLHLFRRLPPSDAFGFQYPLTIGLYREVMETAILKFSRIEIGDDLLAAKPRKPDRFGVPLCHDGIASLRSSGVNAIPS